MAALASTGLLAGLLTACGGSSGTAGQTSDTLVIDQVFNMTTLDPNQAFDVTAENILLHTYDTLVTFEGDSVEQVEPALAESFESNPDATVFTFHLRDDVTFSDGTELTSADVVFSFNRLKNLKASPSYLMEGLSVAAPDEHTVEVSSETPRPELPMMLTSGVFSVINSEVAKEHGATDAEDASTTDEAGPVFDETSLGSGQYVLETYEPNSQLILTANENYWGEQPEFTRLVFRNTASPQQQALNVENGDADFAMNLSSPMLADLDTSKVQTHSTTPPQVIYLALTNTPDSPTANADFREAIALGIDYEGLLELGGPGSVQGTGLIPPSVPGSLPEEAATQRDVAAAKQALAASGVTDTEIVLEYGSDYKVGGLDMGTFAQRIAASLDEVGITVTLKPGPTQVSRTRYQEGKIQAALWPFPPNFPDPSQFLIYNPGGLLAERIHWSPEENPEIAALGEAAAVTVDQEERLAAFQKWDTALKATHHFIPVLTPASNVVADAGLTGVNLNPSLGTNFGKIGRG